MAIHVMVISQCTVGVDVPHHQFLKASLWGRIADGVTNLFKLSLGIIHCLGIVGIYDIDQ